LKVLINDNILKKEDEYYILTSDGTKVITSIDGSTIKDNKKPVACAFVLVQDNMGKILFSIRAKQPFLDVLNM